MPGVRENHPIFGGDPAGARAAFEAWAAHLDARPEPPIEHTYPTRVSVLRAETRVPHPQASTGTVRVILTVEIDLDDQDAEKE